MVEAARDEEMKIPWQEANDGPPVTEEQYQERFFGGEDWMELDSKQQLKSSSSSSERKMREATTWRGQQRLLRSSTRGC